MIKKMIIRLKWHLAPYINFKTPSHIDLELSTRCNLRCSFCFRNEVKIKQQYIDYKLAIKVLDQIKNQSVKFNWRGETLIHPDFSSIIDYAKNYKNIYTMLHTSLALDDPTRVIDALTFDIDELKISIDSCRPLIYSKIRKGSILDNVLRNTRVIQQARLFAGLKSVIINRRTSEITEPEKEFTDFFKGYKIDSRPAMKRCDTHTVKDNNKKKRKYCGQPSRRLVIAADGGCYLCCVAYKEQPSAYIGDANKMTIKELWDSPRRKKMAKQIKKGFKNGNLPPVCQECTSGESYK
jgi:MoaA/NifB/PqqE/SkfB family radical SAM enzyme